MTNHQQNFVKYWIPVVLFICLMVVYVWSSATRVQIIESLGLENSRDIEKLEKESRDKFNRIDDKLDIILQKLR